MGHPYRVSGRVLPGKQLGRRMKTPTANIAFPQYALVPAHGVYVTTVTVDGKSYPAITNVGLRPTVEVADEANCESFLLDFDGSLYDKQVEITFLRFLRPEQKFDSTEALQAQIAADVAAAQAYHKERRGRNV